MPANRPSLNEEIAAAELASKAHDLAGDPEILAAMDDGKNVMEEIAASVNLTEAPEDAVWQRHSMGWSNLSNGYRSIKSRRECRISASG